MPHPKAGYMGAIFFLSRANFFLASRGEPYMTLFSLSLFSLIAEFREKRAVNCCSDHRVATPAGLCMMHACETLPIPPRHDRFADLSDHGFPAIAGEAAPETVFDIIVVDVCPDGGGGDDVSRGPDQVRAFSVPHGTDHLVRIASHVVRNIAGQADLSEKPRQAQDDIRESRAPLPRVKVVEVPDGKFLGAIQFATVDRVEQKFSRHGALAPSGAGGHAHAVSIFVNLVIVVRSIDFLILAWNRSHWTHGIVPLSVASRQRLDKGEEFAFSGYNTLSHQQAQEIRYRLIDITSIMRLGYILALLCIFASLSQNIHLFYTQF